MMKKPIINIIGGGLAGSECAYKLAENDFKVNLFEMKPLKFSPAHKNPCLAEIVCSNSLKGEDKLSSSGLLKSELKAFNSLILDCAEKTRVPSGNALSVDREKFSALVDKVIRSHKNITVIEKEVTEIPTKSDDLWVIATGPLTSEKLMQNLQSILGKDNLFFFDASAPIVTKESLDREQYFIQNRYGEAETGDYINCPLTKEQYEIFYNELIKAKTIELKDFETSEVFEGCMPIEVMAKRGKDSLRFGPMKPVGLNKNPKFGKCYAVVQLRKENIEEQSYNLVGFQTNLTFSEQKRVFSLIPALNNAEFIKYGVMHKNNYINSPKHLNNNYQLKKYPHIYFAGQISGVEGYVESTASGMSVAISIISLYNNNKRIDFDNTTLIGALANYISNPANENNFQPMNSNYGILQNLEEVSKKVDKSTKREMYYNRSMESINKIKENMK